MNKFVWKFTMVPELGKYRYSFLQYVEKDVIIFWAILHKGIDGLYAPILFKKDRNGYITTPEYLPLNDAKEAVEKKLFDDGVIQDGDIVEDETE